MEESIIKKYHTIWVILLLIVSCDKDFLSEDPKGILDPSALFQTNEGIVSVANGLPANLSAAFNSSSYIIPFMGGDDLTTYSACCKMSHRSVDIFDPYPVNAWLSELWCRYYETIHTANLILAYYTHSNDQAGVIDDCLGRAYFYRAFCYSLLTRIWGKVPLYTEYRVDRDYSSIPYSDVEDIYALLVSDLLNAEQLLPAQRTDGSYPGAKPVKGAAKALLSQVYLTMAGWPLKKTSNYELAAAKAKEVIDEVTGENAYGYELLSDPNDLWTWGNNYTNKEIIFGLYYNYDLGQFNMHAPLGARPQEYQNPDASWASGWCDYYGEISFFRRFPPGPRKDATYQTLIPVSNAGEVMWDDDRTWTKHPYFKKYQDDFPGATWAGSRTEQLIRYAEVLLTYAEAKAMSGGPDETAYNALNKVRNGAGLPDIAPGLSAEAFRDSVVAERGWEFAGGEPASRWFDLIRLERVEEATLLRDSTENPLNHHPTHDDYWRPIP